MPWEFLNKTILIFLLRSSYQYLVFLRYIHGMKNHILVVEDDASICDAVKLILEYAGYAVQTCTDGHVIEELLHDAHGSPQMILMDIYLSGNDGRVLTKKLKQEQTTRNIPVLMMSANLQADSDARKVGADDFIPKPFDVTTLLGKVRRYVN